MKKASEISKEMVELEKKKVHMTIPSIEKVSIENKIVDFLTINLN